ncbi:peptidyl-prolyl cis-trans isomerase FKBP53-like [Salvia miltiorrhiza]|uniref:peptidyl-prolyl cis-trans isomerase FKBP53-like n=1 Tax=Salvia miltiorrhiza TaxID=226208 RepID=UPI0025ACC42C|nr:peptidyl-prolyl cis-trans isomerase FKBP53-like [Salvia miltiorrhiza]
MAFWGVEVRPGQPITHSCEKARGRLRISQATLGFGESLKSSVVQCNVGNKSPVLLCVLLPGRVESSHVELEFEEADDVIFSVVGPRSVYLSGYYIRQNGRSNSRSDTESYGVDIEHSPTDRSNYNSDDDDGYEDSFINDDELQVSSPGSHIFYSKGMDEVMPEKNKSKSKKGRSKLRRKKQWMIESDNDVSSPQKEDEAGEMDDESKRDAKCDVGESDDEAKDDDIYGSETKQEVDPLDISDKTERVTQQPSLDEEGIEVNEMQSLDQEKPTKKRKECLLTERTSEVQTDNEDPSVPRECKENEAEASSDLMGVGGDHLMRALELDSANGQKSKKRRSELLGGELTEGTDEKYHNISEDLFDQGSLHTDNVTKHLPAANGDGEQKQKQEETSMEKCGVECHNVQSDDEVMQDVLAERKSDYLPAEIMQEVCVDSKKDDLPAEVMQEEHIDRKIDDLPAEVMKEEHAERKSDDLPASNEDNKEGQIDRNISTKSELLVNDSQPDKIKKKKKKKKTKDKKDLNMSATQMSDNQDAETETETESTKIVALDTRTLSSGLTIKELRSGPPGGKVAALGKKIKIYYSGMLMETGHVYDSNVGKSAFKFVLGDEEYIDGWNVGIDGMCVGDKRRLIIPPSMGYGDVQVGENIPPNSWLIYDIELVRVYG